MSVKVIVVLATKVSFTIIVSIETNGFKDNVAVTYDSK